MVENVAFIDGIGLKLFSKFRHLGSNSSTLYAKKTLVYRVSQTVSAMQCYVFSNRIPVIYANINLFPTSQIKTLTKHTVFLNFRVLETLKRRKYFFVICQIIQYHKNTVYQVI